MEKANIVIEVSTNTKRGSGTTLIINKLKLASSTLQQLR